MKKFKTTQDEYQFYVTKGREAVMSIECYQVKVAAMATKVCEINHGGRARSTTYTLSKYANDIGLNRKTLSEWVRIYRAVVSKLDLDIETFSKNDWITAGRVMELVTEEKRVKQALLGIKKRKQRGVKVELSADKIKELFNQSEAGTGFQGKVYQWTKTVSYIKGKISEADLSEASLGSLITLKESLDNASDSILRYLTGSMLKSELGSSQSMVS